MGIIKEGVLYTRVINEEMKVQIDSLDSQYQELRNVINGQDAMQISMKCADFIELASTYINGIVQHIQDTRHEPNVLLELIGHDIDSHLLQGSISYMAMIPYLEEFNSEIVTSYVESVNSTFKSLFELAVLNNPVSLQSVFDTVPNVVTKDKFEYMPASVKRLVRGNKKNIWSLAEFMTARTLVQNAQDNGATKIVISKTKTTEGQVLIVRDDIKNPSGEISWDGIEVNPGITIKDYISGRKKLQTVQGRSGIRIVKELSDSKYMGILLLNDKNTMKGICIQLT